MEEIKHDAVWHDFFYTELTTGLRRGEICGLMWSDFDERKGTLTVRRTVHQRKGGGLTTGETKTGKGRRTITLPPSTVRLLKERKKQSYSNWIFSNPIRPEMPVSPGSAYNHMKTLLKNAGLPSIRFHDGCIKIGLNQKHPHSKGRTDLVLFLFYKHKGGKNEEYS